MINPYTILKNLLLALLILPSAYYSGCAQTAVSNRVAVSPLRIDPLIEGKTYTFNIQLDEPIICPNNAALGECYVIYYLDNPEPNLIDISPCWIRWDIYDWSKPRQFTIRGIPHYLNVPQREFTIKPRVIESKSDYYSGYQPASITIKTKPVPTATCSSTGDPHYTTFDGYYFHYYGRGKTWLVNGGPNLAIQTVTHGSGYSRNCAVAVLENGNYVTVSVCRGYIEFASSYLNPDKTTSPTVIKSGSNYDIKYPSGVAISFQTWGSDANVYVTLPGTYYQAGIAGLCGNWDGNSGNEAFNYVNNEIINLPLFAVVTPNQVDLFSVTQAQIQASIIATDAAGNTKLLQGQCSYVPPKYIQPILNNPDAEDITNIIKQITQNQNTAPGGSGGFIAGNDTNSIPVFDLPEEDIQDVIPVAPVTDDTMNELLSSCRAFAAHPDLVRCPRLNPTQDITACLADLQLHPSMDVVATSLTALLARCKTQATLAIVPVDSSPESANNAVQKVIAVDPCFGITCNIGARCNPSSRQCQCIDASMRGTRCNIPINTTPSVTGFRPIMLQMDRESSSPAGTVNPAFLEIANFDPLTDNITCMVNGSPVNATILGENLASCNTDIRFSRADGKVFINGREYQAQNINMGSNDKIYSLANKWEFIINGNGQKANPTWQQIVYSNPCVHCAVDAVTGQETCSPAANTCFPTGYSMLTSDARTLAPVIAAATCVAPESPVSQNPCLICRNHSTIFTPLLGCMPKFAIRELAMNTFEDDSTRIFKYQIDTRLSDEWQTLTYLKPSTFITKIKEPTHTTVAGSGGHITTSVDYIDGQLIIKLDYTDGILEPVKIPVGGYIALYYNNTEVDTVPISLTFWPKYRTTTILTTTVATTSGQQTRSQSSVEQYTSSPTDMTPPATTTQQQARCVDLACGDYCYKMRSDVTGCIYKCLCETDPITILDDGYNNVGYTTIPASTTTEPTEYITITDIQPDDNNTDTNTVVTGKSASNGKLSIPGIAIIACIALVVLITMLIVAIRIRNMPLKDIPAQTPDKSTRDFLGSEPIHGTARPERMEYNPLYLGMASAVDPSVIITTQDSIDNPMYDYQHQSGYWAEDAEATVVQRTRPVALVANSIYQSAPGMPEVDNIYGGCANTGYNNSRIKNTPVEPTNGSIA